VEGYGGKDLQKKKIKHNAQIFSKN